MRLEKQGPVEPKFRSTFTCSIDTMLGDGDAFGEVEIALQGHEVPLLEQVLKTIEIGYNDEKLHEIPNASRFFGVDGGKLNPDKWPYNYDCGCYYGYQSHEYFWYDAAGRKFHATLKEQ